MRLASRGLRDLDDGPEPISDPVERRAVRAEALRVALRSAAATAAVLGLVWLLR